MRNFKWFLSGLLLSFSLHAAVVNVEEAIVRSGPSADADIVSKVQKGSRVKIADKKDDWYLCETEDNRIGWLPKNAIKLTLAEESEEAAAKAAAAAPAAAAPAITPEAPKPTQVTKTPAASPEKPLGLDEQLTTAPPYKEYHQLMLGIRPGFSYAPTRPTGVGSSGFAIGAHIGMLMFEYFGLSIPYTFTTYSHANIQSVGGGPFFRYGWEWMRVNADANALYVRALSGNHVGYSFGGDVTFGYPKKRFQPFFGPFFRYEKDYLGTQDLRSMVFGASINLTSLFEIDL